MNRLKQWKYFAILCFAILAGCYGYIGQQAIQQGRGDFNNTIQSTYEQQLFVNLIRVHENHFPFFMDVSEVDESISVSGSLMGGPSGMGGPDVIVNASGAGSSLKNGVGTGVTSSLTGTVMYTDSPTIRYVPLTGSALVSQLATPVNVDSVQQLVDSGWNIATVLSLTAKRLTPNDNARIRDQLLCAIDRLDRDGCLSVAAIKWPPPGALMPTSPAESIMESITTPTTQTSGNSPLQQSVTWTWSTTQPTTQPFYITLNNNSGNFASPTPGPLLTPPQPPTQPPPPPTHPSPPPRGPHIQGGPSPKPGPSPSPGASSAAGGGTGSSGGQGSQQGPAAANNGDDTLVLYFDIDACSPDKQANALRDWHFILCHYNYYKAGYFFPNSLDEQDVRSAGAIKFLRLPTVPTTDVTDASVSLDTFTRLNGPPLQMRSAMGVLLSSVAPNSWMLYHCDSDDACATQPTPPCPTTCPCATQPDDLPAKHLVTVHVSAHAPTKAYVAHQGDDGMWYYVDGNDSCSQKNFMLLSLLMTIQSGPPSVSPLTPTFNVGIGH